MRRIRLAFAAILAFTSTSPFLAHAQPGSLDITFNPGAGVATFTGGAWVLSTALRSDGKVMIGGTFNFVNGQPRNYVARLNADGSVDDSFTTLQGAGGYVNSVEVDPEGRVYIGGSFTGYNGIDMNKFARLREDGSLDLAWTNTGVWPNRSGSVQSIKRQPDGKFLLHGSFSTFNGQGRNSLARLNSDGTLDPTYNPGACAPSGISSFAIQPDGNLLLVGGYFTNGGVSRVQIARASPTGVLDTTFATEPIAGGSISACALQSDGKIWVIGNFTSINGYWRPHLARLNTNGMLDTTFVFPSDVSSDSYLSAPHIEPLADGKMLFVGNTTCYVGGQTYNNLVRFNPDGSCDTAFRPDPNGQVRSFLFQPDGKLLVGGGFTSIAGTNINGIARLNADDFPSPGLQFLSANIYFGTYLYGTVSKTYRMEWTSKLDTPSLWNPLLNVTLQTNPQLILDPTPATGARFYRAIELSP